MVLRGAQFQRSGPAGCKFLTRRALSSYRATFEQGQSDAVCLLQGRWTTHRRLMHSTAELSIGNLTKDSCRLAREGDLCHGHIGESSSGLQPW